MDYRDGYYDSTNNAPRTIEDPKEYNSNSDVFYVEPDGEKPTDLTGHLLFIWEWIMLGVPALIFSLAFTVKGLFYACLIGVPIGFVLTRILKNRFKKTFKAGTIILICIVIAFPFCRAYSLGKIKYYYYNNRIYYTQGQNYYEYVNRDYKYIGPLEVLPIEFRNNLSKYKLSKDDIKYHNIIEFKDSNYYRKHHTPVSNGSSSDD